MDQPGGCFVEDFDLVRSGDLSLHGGPAGNEPAACGRDQGLHLTGSRQGIDLRQQKVDDGRLAEKFGAGFGRRIHDPARGEVHSPQPGTNGDQSDEFGVILLGHFELHLILCGFQFLPQRVPIAGIREVIDAVCASEDALTDIEAFGKAEDILANIFDGLAVLGFHGDISVGDKGSEHEGDLGTGGRAGSGGGPETLPPCHGAGLVDCGKKFTGHGHRDRSQAFDGPHLCRAEHGRIRGRCHRRQAGRKEDQKIGAEHDPYYTDSMAIWREG